MTTLFPQIKRVDEDETSKIIKNVLFDDQDEIKLEQIFDEFMHLTEESITYTDDDDEQSENLDQDTNDKDADEDDDEEDDDEDDDDAEDDEDDDNDGSSDSDSDESGSSESDDDKPEVKAETTPSSNREPISWNLDQFIKTIPVTKPTITKPENGTAPKKNACSNVAQLSKPPTKSSQNHSTKRQEHKETKFKKIEALSPPPPPPPPPLNDDDNGFEEWPTSKRKADHNSRHTDNAKATAINGLPVTTGKITEEAKIQEVEREREKEKPAPALAPAPAPVTPVTPVTSHRNSQPSNTSFIVQIDTSKLKRIPTGKAPTPTTSFSSSMMTAKALKHEADAEKDKTKQAIKYLESSMYFVLHGYELESQTKNQSFYIDTIPLFKHSLRLSMPNSENLNNMTSLKVHTLNLRCLSLLYMKLYKLRERELHENNKLIQSQQNSSPVQQADTLLVGIKPQLLSAYKRQIAIFNHLKYANDYWQQADQFCDQHPAVRIFFSTIESNCGALTMTSQFPKLMDHVKCGLKLLRPN